MRKSSRVIYITPRASRGRIPRVFIGISGSSSPVMRAVRFFPAALLFVIPAARAQETPPTPDQGIHVSVERVNVGVIVTDARGNFVGGLRREDFHLFDNTVEQPISDFAAIEEPAQVLLLIEAGPAVYLLEGGHLQAAHSLLNGLSSGDRIAV